MEASPLMRLPPELRNAVYEYALTESYGVRLDFRSRLKAARTAHIENGYDNQTSIPRPSIALFSTCKQLRKECKALYFSLNTLYLQTYWETPYDPSLWRADLAKWRKDIGLPAFSVIRKVEIDVGDEWLVSFVQTRSRFDRRMSRGLRSIFHTGSVEMSITLHLFLRVISSVPSLTFPLNNLEEAYHRVNECTENIERALQLGGRPSLAACTNIPASRLSEALRDYVKAAIEDYAEPLDARESLRWDQELCV